VREGSGLYFNAILSSSGHSVPPPMTPKSAHRTLLRSSKFHLFLPFLAIYDYELWNNRRKIMMLGGAVMWNWDFCVIVWGGNAMSLLSGHAC